ncbi:MAG: hypothetical protein U0271_30565 [Polyangiaceae bacterium]
MPSLTVSDEVRVLYAPFRTYRELVDEALAEAASAAPTRASWSRIVPKVLVTHLVVAATISMITAGRFVALHVAMVALAWGFAPFIQIAAAVLLRLARPRRLASAHAARLELTGNGALLAFLLALDASIALSSGALYDSLFSSGAIGVVALAALVAGGTAGFAFNRACGCSRGRALGLVLTEWLVRGLLVLPWYQVMNNLIPQVFGGGSR